MEQKIQEMANEFDFRIKLAKGASERSKRTQFYEGKVEGLQSCLDYLKIHLNIVPK